MPFFYSAQGFQKSGSNASGYKNSEKNFKILCFYLQLFRHPAT